MKLFPHNCLDLVDLLGERERISRFHRVTRRSGVGGSGRTEHRPLGVMETADMITIELTRYPLGI